MAIYFSIRACQPFADISMEDVAGYDSVATVIADGQIVGLRIENPREVVRLDEIIEKLDLDPDSIWGRLRADNDVLLGRRQATWGGQGA